jgi:hypothetical protein
MSDLRCYLEWEGLTRPDADAPMVRVHFIAGGWVPYSPATLDDPAEGGLFEDIIFVGADVDPRSMPDALTPAEVEEARAWFKADGWELAQQAAEVERDGPRHPGWRLLEAGMRRLCA